MVRKVHVIGYTRKDGVKVKGHWRILNERTMTKEVPDNIIKGLSEVVEDQDNEYSFGADFERKLVQPERFFVLKGGKDVTIKFDDFEMYGHTHPEDVNPIPSMADLRALDSNEAQFIMAGKTGNTIFYNIEDKVKYHNMLLIMKDANIHAVPGNKRYDFMNKESDREQFFDLTGVKVKPYKRGMKIKLKDDYKLEKQIPVMPKKFLKNE